MIRGWSIVAVSLLWGSCCCGQNSIVGLWSCVETNHVEHNSKHYTYATTTRFVFTTNGIVTVIKMTPSDIQKPVILNTRHEGAYTVAGNSLTITAKEVSGYVMHVPGLSDSYLFGLDGEALVLTNAVTGKSRRLTPCKEVQIPNQAPEDTARKLAAPQR